ncbi:OmpA family protein [Halomonas sp. Bachu 37]|uniref:OmpA/MotB family protein n=1 Tax=Halomonas kashgarensis TaxID=3084920 RepID=UPI0032175378
MLDHDTRQTLEPVAMGGDDESWLTSYLDVLTLLITLFVLLLALTPPGSGDASENQMASSSAVPSASRMAQSTGIQPAHDGIQPRFSGLSIPGVSVDAGSEGVTLRIDDSLLFSSGQAELTGQGRTLIQSLVEVLESFDGQISVEGHTDSIPIATARFPSNWELSSARAIAVVRHLESEGVKIERMRAVGYADTQPMQSNNTREGRAANRRVELLLRQGGQR